MADLHAGVYAGYMLTGVLGLDLGVYYQRSSTFFAIMYDHEVDFVTRLPAPMFLEIPLRIRYFYDLYKGKLHWALYGGVSVLTHFSRDVYNQGTGDLSYYSPAASAHGRCHHHLFGFQKQTGPCRCFAWEPVWNISCP
jgi:hypothetical protein